MRQRLLTAFELSTAEITPEEAAMRDLPRDVQSDLSIEQEHRLARRVERAEERRGIRHPADAAPPSQSPGEPAQSASAAEDQDQAGTMLDSTIVDLWAAERKVQPQGVSMYRAAARWPYERVGRKPVVELTKQNIITFKAKLVEEAHSPANIKNKLSRLRTLLQWAADNGYAASNVADGVTIRDVTAPKNKRRSFDLVWLNAIFGSPLYAQRELPTD